MEYAKLENGKLTKCVIFPNGMAVLNNRFKRNATEADILAAGYLPIEEQPDVIFCLPDLPVHIERRKVKK